MGFRNKLKEKMRSYTPEESKRIYDNLRQSMKIYDIPNDL